MTMRVLLAAGIGMPGESTPVRPHQKRIVRSLRLVPWSGKTRFGWVLSWNGIYWHRSLGIAGPDWDEKSYPEFGPPSAWHKRGPFVWLRWGRRGNLKSTRRFARDMESACPRKGWLWPLGFMHLESCSLHGGRDDGSPWS